jgi:hypothetical protein
MTDVVPARPDTDVWGIGRCVIGDEAVFWSSTLRERARAAAHGARCLAALGVQRASRVVLVTKLSEAVQAVPLSDGLRALGAVVIPAEANGYDAARVRSFVGRLDVHAVLGVTPATVSGIEQQGGELAAFGRVPVVVARPGAYERLQEAGLRPYRWLTLGPAVALECARREGAHVDPVQWELTVDGGEVVLTTRFPVTADLIDLRTGVRAAVITEPCGCGIPGPRVAVS